jgi:hypothetical protein
MKKYARSLLHLALAATSLASLSAHAEVITIPFSASLPRYVDGETCIDETLSFASGGEPCLLRFPLTVPVGKSVQQIAVMYSTNSLFPGTPSIEAWLEIVNIDPAFETQAFLWSSDATVPDGTIATHRLMSTLKGYPDQFAVPSNRTYQVVVHMWNGVSVQAVQVTYN